MGPPDLAWATPDGGIEQLRRPPRQLTPRQHACVVLVARGKSDREIGEILGISDETAHKHVEAAKKRFAVGTRIELVVLALMTRQISFADAIG